MTPLIAAHDVSVILDEETLLPSTSISAAAGEAVAVRGPNGAGKTTLLRALAGLARPSGGRVLLDGEPLDLTSAASARAAREHIAASIGMPPIAPNLTLAEQVRFVRATWGDSDAEGRAAADDLLEEFGIHHLSKRYAHELSSGQRQLFTLALAFARPGRVRLLDEPEQRLDSTRRALVAEAIMARCRAGATVVFATHSASLVSESGAREVWVREAS